METNKEIAQLQVSESTTKLNNALTQLVSSTAQGLEFSEQEMNCFALIDAYLTPDKLKQLRTLEDKQHGFKVAYKKGTTSLSDATFKDCMIEAFRRGLIPTGNTFNILSGNVYTTQEGCKFLLKRMNVNIDKSIYPLSYVDPKGNVVIEPTIEYTYKGQKGVFTQKYVVNSEGNNSEDFRRGKAKRKVLADLIEHITGRSVQALDEDIEAIVEKGVKGEGLKPDSIKGENVKASINNHEEAEIISESDGSGIKMISEEFQKMFDSYISKATDKADLIKRAKIWCESPKAVENGANCYFDSEKGFVSTSVNLDVFNEINKKFEQTQ